MEAKAEAATQEALAKADANALVARARAEAEAIRPGHRRGRRSIVECLGRGGWFGGESLRRGI